MLFLTLTDNAGKRLFVNAGNFAWFGPDVGGKGSLIQFAVSSEGGQVALRVAESPDDIFTQINAKLRK